MGKKAKELRKRKPQFHDTEWTTWGVAVKVTRRFCDVEDVIVDAYTKIDACAALLQLAARYGSDDFGDRIVGLGVILEDIAHSLRVATGEVDAADKIGTNGNGEEGTNE